MSFRRNRIRVISLLLGCLTLLGAPSATPAIVQDRLERLPDKYRKWLEQEVVYIITDREREVFLELEAIGEWDAFIEAFWRRRDPDRLTPVNELKEEHYRRIEFANRELGRESPVPGWMTDRGRMYITLGEPDSRESFTGVGFLYPTELWFYLADRESGLPAIYLLFFQQGVAGPYRLFNHSINQLEELVAGPQQIDPGNARLSVYQMLQNVSPELAHASVRMAADRGGYSDVRDPTVSGLDSQVVLAEIYESPFRRLDISYVDAARDARGLVETSYLFNYVPSTAAAHVMPGPGGTSFVHYSIEIEPQHFTIVRDEDKEVLYTRLIVQGEVTTLDGRPVVQLNKDVYVNLTEAQFPDVSYRPFSYRDMFPLVPGEFHFRLVLKNESRSEYTIFESSLRVPEPSTAPSLGAPVLLYGTSQMPSAHAVEYRTYQFGSLKLEPNSKRVYAIGETLQAYIPTHLAGDQDVLSLQIVSQEEPLQVFASKTVPIAHYEGAPVVESQDLGDLAGGRYRLLVRLLDPAGEELASQSVNFDVTPRASVPRPWGPRESIRGEDSAMVKTALAEQYLRLGESTKAQEACHGALEADPDSTPPRICVGRFLLDQNKPEEALRVLEPAYVRDKENVDLLLTLGDAHYRSRHYQRAAELFEATLVRRRPDTALLNALAVCYGQMGQRDKVLEYIGRSLELDPNQEAAKALKEQIEKSPPPGNP